MFWILVFERFFFRTDRTVTTMEIKFIALLVKTWIQLGIVKGQAEPRIFSEERWDAYLFLRLLLRVGVIHNWLADWETYFIYGIIGSADRKKEIPPLLDV